MPRRTRFVIDRASGRIISAGPEEVDATQPLLAILIDECGWEPGQIVSRPNQWKVLAHPSGNRTWPVDIAIFDEPANKRSEEHILIICECKRPDETSGVEQLKIYLDREPHARVGVWFNGTDHCVVYKIRAGYQVAPLGTPIPGPHDPLHPGERPALLTYPNLRQAPSLVPLFRRIRDRLAAQDMNVNRDEEILPDLSTLLLLKILDEQANRLSPRRPLKFQMSDSNRGRTSANIKEFLNKQVARHSELFGTTEVRLAIDDRSISYIVEELQNYRLLSNDADSISTAFQVIRGKAYKGEEGQYFTPPSVVKIATAALSPTSDDRIIDPACGSGSFLACTLRFVDEQLKTILGENTPEYATAKHDWSTENLYAIDKDSVSVRLSKAYLSLLGDGSTHVYKADSLRPSLWIQHLSAMIPDLAFSVVVTNPPFGTNLRFDPDHGRTEDYQVCRKWVHEEESGTYRPTDDFVSREIGIVFLERCLKLLENGGRMAIVLPDTYLFSPTYQWLVYWLCTEFTITHSINVPIEVFEPHCRAKTSILVLQKARPSLEHEVIGILTESYGEDKHGRPLYRLDQNGNPTSELEDEMTEAAALLLDSNNSESKLKFRFRQSDALQAGVIVASYFWRRPYLEALDAFAREHDCDLVTFGLLIDEGVLQIESGHGSPRSHFKGKGNIPYIKVSDIKNWRMNENPKYFIPEDEAMRLRRNRPLRPYDLVTPTRASKNIGLLGVVMPWQIHSILTKEILIIRTLDETRVSPWFLVVMMSLRVVNDQFKYLVQMQTNREDLGKRLLELQIPIPRTDEGCERWARHVRNYFTALTEARSEYDMLIEELNVQQFVDRP